MGDYVYVSQSAAERRGRQLEISIEIGRLMDRVRDLRAEHEAISRADQPVYMIRKDTPNDTTHTDED